MHYWKGDNFEVAKELAKMVVDSGISMGDIFVLAPSCRGTGNLRASFGKRYNVRVAFVGFRAYTDSSPISQWRPNASEGKLVMLVSSIQRPRETVGDCVRNEPTIL